MDRKYNNPLELSYGGGCESESDTSLLCEYHNIEIHDDDKGSLAAANLLMFISVLLYSGNAVFVRYYMVEGGTPESFLFLRSLFSMVLLLILLYGEVLFGARELKDVSVIEFGEDDDNNWIMVSGCLCGALRQNIVPFVITTLEASTMSIITPAIPLITAMLAHFVKLEKITKMTMFSIVLASFGVCFGLNLANNFNASTKTTYFMLFMVPVTKALQVILLRISTDNFDRTTLLRNQIVISIIVSLATSVIITVYNADESVVDDIISLATVDLEHLICVAYSAVGIIYFGWKIQIYSLKVLGATTVALFQMLRPFATILLGNFFIDEEITLRKILGSAVICLSLFLHQRYKRQ